MPVLATFALLRVGADGLAFPNNSLEKLTKTTLGKLMIAKLGSISRDAFRIAWME
jgi:hypothetical protein